MSLSRERRLERNDLGVMFTDPAFLDHRTRNSVVTPGRDLYHAPGMDDAAIRHAAMQSSLA